MISRSNADLDWKIWLSSHATICSHESTQRILCNESSYHQCERYHNLCSWMLPPHSVAARPSMPRFGKLPKLVNPRSRPRCLGNLGIHRTYDPREKLNSNRPRNLRITLYSQRNIPFRYFHVLVRLETPFQHVHEVMHELTVEFD